MALGAKSQPTFNNDNSPKPSTPCPEPPAKDTVVMSLQKGLKNHVQWANWMKSHATCLAHERNVEITYLAIN